MITAAPVRVALAATFSPPARAQIVAAGFVPLCIAALMRHGHRSGHSGPQGGSAHPQSKE